MTDVLSRVLEMAGPPPEPPEIEPPWMPAEDRPARVQPPVLLFRPVAEVLAAVASAPRPTFLARPVWPADAYGILGATMKAGKTWLVLDLVLAVLTGGAWLGRYPIERSGSVLMFLGEGGPRKMTRRLRAVAAFYGAELGEQPLRMCFRAPHLTNAQQLQTIAEELKTNPPVLVVLDPLYLSARGAQGSQLYEMGEVLEALQSLCQSVGAALVVVHHHNRAEGRGMTRLSGAGPAEWGRVIVSAERKAEHVDPSTLESAVTLDIDFIGDEIPETTLRIRRKVRAVDPEDLSSPLVYSVEVLEGDAPTEDDRSGMRPAHRRVLAVLEAVEDDRWLMVREIGDRLAVDTTGLSPLKERTIQDALKVLTDGGQVEVASILGSPTRRWRAVRADLKPEEWL